MNPYDWRFYFQLAKQRNIGSIVGRIKDAVVDESAKNVARDIVEMTHAV